MVLGDLGTSIANALSKLNRESKIDDEVLTALLNDLTRALLASDVNMDLIQRLNRNIKNAVSLKDLPTNFDVRRVIEKAVIEEVTLLLDSGHTPKAPSRSKTNVIMFVGLQGSGKTTTCTKLAYYYRTRGWKVGLVCADTFRAGAFDQLRQNATKAKIPYFGKRDESDPVVIAAEGVRVFKQKKFEIIIVDTSGRHKQEEALFEEMEAISAAVKPNETIFVLDSTIGQAAEAQAEAFKERVDVGSVIVTKLDGHARGGGALSAVAKTGAPITFIGVGEHMNELEKFNTKRFVQRILGRGDIETLVERVKEHQLDDQKELMRQIQKGKFTLQMMREQFQNILKMGSFGQIMQMIPGLNNMPKESEQASQKRLQSFLVMMDSMTEEELNAPDISFIEQSASRRRRICRGSGVLPHFMNELIAVYKPFAAAAGKMKKMPFGKNGEMPKNPQQMGKLANMMPQSFLKQIGGQQGFMNLMQKFQGAEGGGGGDPMGNMQSMMKNMGNMQKLMRKQPKRRR
eukprot:CAMPEP_0202701938 /NCGR_PEP_ID=MMETSP1385-20130828/14979_1 /ASSEMBLY_ACC=CAM_ASM_000861 /TAXON_ID=933848 /ORGANISM="Elphidium margaritaceum" /LENGTH=514 /DNA_ID=CAMNT_0049359469 /DNA_START=38 /DNA_END=1582 /DNA_ORIENTATION=-